MDRITDLTNDGDCNRGPDPVNGSLLPYPVGPAYLTPFIGSA